MKSSTVHHEIRRLRQQIIENLDMKLNVIDAQLDSELTAKLINLQAQLKRESVNRDTMGDMLLRLYA